MPSALFVTCRYVPVFQSLIQTCIEPERSEMNAR